jgi:hypothetical protein
LKATSGTQVSLQDTKIIQHSGLKSDYPYISVSESTLNLQNVEFDVVDFSDLSPGKDTFDEK